GGKIVRLDKLLAHTGHGTRKDVKELLKKKQVKVDGVIAKKGNAHINPDVQTVQVGQEIIQYEKYVYLLLHKPPNYVSATRDDRDKTVIDLVPSEYQHYDLAPVGRLDKDTEGLVFLTNDGLLNHRLTSPKHEVFKTYYAKIRGRVEPKHITIFQEGVILDDGYKTKRANLEIIKSDDISEITISISEGKCHAVKRMCRAINMEVTYLKRLSSGELKLDSSASLGKTRPSNEEQMNYTMVLKEE